MPQKMPKIKVVALFKPFDWQVAPWRDTSPILLLTGSAGGGKSKLAGEKLHGFCKRYPGAMALMVRKTRESMTNSTVLFMERNVIQKDPEVHHVQWKHRFEYSNGSILAYGGMKDEKQREQIRSMGMEGGLDIVWMEEASEFTENDFNEILARMRGQAAPWRQIILTTNPDAPKHWIYRRLILGKEATVYYSSVDDNPLATEEYKKSLAKISGVLGKRLREGKWIQAEGVIYDNFDPAVHVIKSFPIPRGWRRIRAIDFGYTLPFVCLWIAESPEGAMYVYRELYMTRKVVSEHAKSIIKLSEGEDIEATICDHDAEGRATLEMFDILTTPADKRVSVGIQAVYSALTARFEDGVLKTDLYFMKDALVERDNILEQNGQPTCLLEEITGYSWNERKDAPLKHGDHSLDALRYGVMYLKQGLGGVYNIQIGRRLTTLAAPEYLLHRPTARKPYAKPQADTPVSFPIEYL